MKVVSLATFAEKTVANPEARPAAVERASAHLMTLSRGVPANDLGPLPPRARVTNIAVAADARNHRLCLAELEAWARGIEATTLPMPTPMRDPDHELIIR